MPEKPTWLTLDTWLVSDAHFNHHNTIRYCNRQSECPNDFVHHWQTMVRPEDKLLHLGDVIFGNKQDCVNFMCTLPGEKHLIIGNHDRGTNAMRNLGFNTFLRKPSEAEFSEHIVVFSHYPFFIDNLPIIRNE